ncbi:MAG: lysophospholipase L1-like esterase [Planctomycetota bacterium]|jgi:lysophospholipase L1-like esterase
MLPARGGLSLASALRIRKLRLMESKDENAKAGTPGPEQSTGSGKGRWKRRCIALFLGLAVPFLVGEFAVRLTLGSPLSERLPIMEIQANAQRGWEMVPSTTHYTYQHAVHVNALGLRGAEIQPKQTGERRVLALGDSLIYGQGVGGDETVPAYLEGLLRARGVMGTQNWSVVNAGHRAYDTHQELGLLRELGEEINADVIVLFWYWNDINERDMTGTFERLSASGPIFFDTGDKLEGMDEWRWRVKQFARRSALVMALYDIFAQKTPEPQDPGYVDAALLRLGDYLDEFVHRARKMGVALYLAPIPDSGALLGDHPGIEVRERAITLAKSKGIQVIDLVPGLRTLAEERGSLPILPFDGHYQPEGNAAIAEAVATVLDS